MTKRAYRSPGYKRYKAKRRYVRRYKKRTPVMRKKSKVYDSMFSKFDVAKPIIHEAAIGFAGISIRWSDNANPGGVAAARMLNFTEASEFPTVSAAFRQYKVTYCKIRIDVFDFDAGGAAGVQLNNIQRASETVGNLNWSTATIGDMRA